MTEPSEPSTGPDPRDASGRVARNVASLIVSQFVTWGFSAIAILIVPRYLGTEALGKLGIAAAVWTIAMIGIRFGSTRLLTREVARRPDHGSELLSAAVPVSFGLWTVCAVAIAGFAVVSDMDDTLFALLVIGGASAALLVLSAQLDAVLTGRERITLVSSVNVVGRAVTALATVGVVLLDGSVEVVAIASGVGSLVTVPWFLWVIHRDALLWLRPRVARAREVVRDARPFLFMGGAMVLYQEVDVIAISALAEASDVGLYTATDRLFGAMIVIPASVAAALYPTLSRRWVENPDGVLDTIRSAMRVLALLTMPIGVGAMILGDPIARLVFGEEFARSGDVTQIYGLVIWPLSWTILIGMFTEITGRQRLWTAVLVASAAATIPLDIVLVPWAERTFDNAAIAGALTYLITETAAVIFGLIVVIPGAITRELLVQMGRAGLALAAMAVVVVLLSDLFVLIPVLAGGLVYVAALFVARAISPAELATLGLPVGRIPGMGGGAAD